MSVYPGLSYYPSLRVARGFTLVELLTVIAIVSLLLTASLGSIRIASRSLQAAHAQTEKTHHLRVTSGFLRRQFSQLIPAIVSEDGDEQLFFRGEEHRVRFVAPGPRKSFGVGLMAYELESVEDGNSATLVLRYSPLDPSGSDSDNPLSTQSIQIADSLNPVTFDYYGSAAVRLPPRWHSPWPADSDRHPELIRVRTQPDSIDSSGWPEIVFHVRTGRTR
jgi:general secretion pathway protein J